MKKTLFQRPVKFLADFMFTTADGITQLARYLHYHRIAHMEFEPREDDIFIVTYPRSGTTWLQMILYQLSGDGSMEMDHIAQKIPWFERLIHYRIWQAEDFAAMASPRIFKSHLPAGEIPKGTGKVIYMARNGYDVALSYHAFYRSHLGFQGDFATFLNRFMDGDLQYGSWFDHVAQWKRSAEKTPSNNHGKRPWSNGISAPPENENSEGDFQGKKVLFLTFEEMKQDFDAGLDKIIAFTGLRIDPARRPDIIHRCTLPFMKRHEQKFDHITAQIWEKNVQRSAFIRSGDTGQGRSTFPQKDLDRFQTMVQDYHLESICP